MKVPTELHLFVSNRLRYLSVAAEIIYGFAPDGRSAEYCADQVRLEGEAWGELSRAQTAANISLGKLDGAFPEMHATCVAVHVCMKTFYRKDRATLASIRKLPTQDQSPARTLARAKALSALWDDLPDVPGTSGPMVVGDLTAAAFALRVKDFDGTIIAAKLGESQFSAAVATYREKNEDWNSFVSAGRAQGVVLYKEEDSPERVLIDRIPVMPSTERPKQAEITKAESPAPGKSQLAFEAKHATSFKVWRKGPGENEFKEVADVLLPGEFTDTGLAAGTYEYYVEGVNSRGAGEASAIATVQVAAQAVA